MKNTITLNEQQLRKVIEESVWKVLMEGNALDEMGLHNKKTGKIHTFSYSHDDWAPDGDEWVWKWDGDKVDRHMWRMKKLAQKKVKVGQTVGQ